MKKVLSLTVIGFISLLLVGCGQQKKSDIVEQEAPNVLNQQIEGNKTRAYFSNDEKMNIHMCLMGGGENCDPILDENNKNTYADAIKEQCEIMAGMQVCDTYFDTETEIIDAGDTYDLSAKDSYKAKQKQEIVELEDGDSYTITLENINHTIDGKEVRMMAYNGSIPGPLIKVKQGARITLNVTNNIADITSTIHHHGLRGEDKHDGVPKGMGGFDIPMKKGDSIEYKLDFPDAGIYRYHPHVREDLQQELGMYGNYVVVPNDETYWNEVDDEQVLILDDIQLDADGIVPFYKDHANQTIMGRFGTHYLINGSEKYRLNLTQGKVTRLYVTNSANVRPFNISIPGVDMKLVGGDLGAYEKETMIDSLLIAPAERYIIELYPTESGTFDLIYKNPAFTTTLGSVEVALNDEVSSAGNLFNTLRAVEQVITDIDAYREYFDKPVDKRLRLDMTLNGKTKDDLSLKMEHAHDGSTASLGGLTYDLGEMEWLDEMFDMNMASTDKGTKRQLIDEDTNKVSTDIDDWKFTQGDLIKVRITNDGEGLHPMQHPIHFHGQRFLVTNKNGVPNDNMVWMDTVLTLPGEYLDILIDMSNLGKWMAHCHIAEHMHAGMMMNFEVLPKVENDNREGEDDMRIIEVEATRFKFTPAQIRVKQGEKVALRINDVDTDHGAEFGEMDVYYQENGNILLDTSTPGTYEYRCATMCGSGHQEMKGVVIVEWRYKKTNKEMFGEIIQLLKTSKKLLYSVYNPKKPDR